MFDCDCPLKIAAKEEPLSLAYLAKDVALTYKELDALTELFVERLHGCNIRDGDRIAVLHPPCQELISLFFAAWRIGASICPLNLRLPTSQVESCLKRIEPKLFINSFPFNKSNRPGEVSDPIYQSILLFTSGSSGPPKVAILSLKSLIANATFSVPLDTQDRWLLSLPLFHVGGIGIMMRCILSKATIVLDESDPKITHLSYVPTQLYRTSPLYKKLKCVLLGGAPINTIPERLPIYVTYGLTEMGSMVLARKQPPCINGHFYLGKPLPKREIRLEPDGEIWVKGATLFQRYLHDDSPFINGWFPTGDIGQYDEKEGYTIIGRKDWQFISGGENIQPEEIEQQLLQIPDILEAVVAPKPDPEFGMRPIAFIRTVNPLFSLQMMHSLLAERLPKYKIPIALYLIDEFPKNGLKIDRKQFLPKIYAGNSHTETDRCISQQFSPDNSEKTHFHQ